MNDERPLTDVAVGLVFDRDGRVLLGQRPAGKPYAGWWEFPGGKLEAGESVADALARELHEELGIRVRSSSPWIVREHSYPHARVRLHFRQVFDWTGEPVAREGQAFGWTRPDAIDREPLLPATVPILGMLALPRRVIGLAVDRLASRPPAAPGRIADARSQGIRPRVLFVLGFADTPPGTMAGPATSDPAWWERGLARLRAIPGAIVCAGEACPEQLQAACDGIVIGPERLPVRRSGAGLLGLRIAKLDQLALIDEADADFAVVTADVSACCHEFDRALAVTPMPVYLRVTRGHNAGMRRPGLQGTASGDWPDAWAGGPAGA